MSAKGFSAGAGEWRVCVPIAGKARAALRVIESIGSSGSGTKARSMRRACRTLRMTPAMAAGITDRLWTVADIVDLLEAKEAADQAAKPARGPRDYKALPLTPIKVKN